MNLIDNYRQQIGLFYRNKPLKPKTSDKFVQLNLAFLNFTLILVILLGHLFKTLKHSMKSTIKIFLMQRITITFSLLCYSSPPPLLSILDAHVIKFSAASMTIALITVKSFKIITGTCPKFFTMQNSKTLCAVTTFTYNFSTWLFLCGDIEKNPPPSNDYFKFMHWNANSLPAHDFARIPLIQLYNTIHDFNIIAITESALKNEIPNDKIDIPGFTPIRCDLPENDSHGGVLIYHKNDLAVKKQG